jgi:biotin synthase
MTKAQVAALARRAAERDGLTRAEALALASDATLDDLVQEAGTLARQFAGVEVEFCSIVNARSGRCPNNCAFCAQSIHHNTGAPVYELIGRDALMTAARKAAAVGACRFSIVTSGPSVSDEAEFERICDAVRAIAALGTVSVCASLGTLTLDRARRLKAAGLTRYHHNLETSARYYPTICSTQDYDEKVETLRAARDAGLEVCSGGIFGLGEGWADRVDMAMALREIGVDSVAVNFLTPIPGTRLENQAVLSPEEALRMIAIYRFIFPRVSIRLCGGREAALGGRQDEIFAAGADAAMIGNYLTTLGRPPKDDLKMVAALGLTVRTQATSEERSA